MSDSPMSHQTVTVEQPTTFHTESGLQHQQGEEGGEALSSARAEVEQWDYVSVSQPQTFHNTEDCLQPPQPVSASAHCTDDFYVSVCQPSTYTDLGRKIVHHGDTQSHVEMYKMLSQDVPLSNSLGRRRCQFTAERSAVRTLTTFSTTISGRPDSIEQTSLKRKVYLTFEFAKTLY